MNKDNIDIVVAQMEALNNCLNYYNLTGYKINKYWQDDKRRSKPLYFITDDKGNSLTGHWEYSELNHFISGYGKAYNKRCSTRNNDKTGVEVFENDIVMSAGGREEYKVIWQGSGFKLQSLNNPNRIISLLPSIKNQIIIPK